ncbi:MAG: hypothetical protein QXT63_07435 [Thermoplasmata archaeon]
MTLYSLLDKNEFALWEDTIIIFEDGSTALLIDILEEDGFPKYLIVRLNHKAVAIPSYFARELEPGRIILTIERWHALDLPEFEQKNKMNKKLKDEIELRLYSMGLIDRISSAERVKERDFEESRLFPEKEFVREAHDVYPSENIQKGREFYPMREYEPAYGWPEEYLLRSEVENDTGWRPGTGTSRITRAWRTVE